MGIYLNPGNTAYKEALNSEIYVDKTGMIACLNDVVSTKQKYVCISRPRRFGKTMAADMISAYYDKNAESRALFADKKLATLTDADSWDRFLGKFDVIRIVTTDFMKKRQKRLTAPEFIENMQKMVAGDIARQYSDISYSDTEDLIQTMAELYQATKNPFVIVIDEWDAVFREYKEDADGQKLYLDFLRDWLKDKVYVALAYMTGILPIKKYGKHSALNMFNEYSMISPLQFASYTGFTEDEVKELCSEYGRDYEEIKNWYDGYTVTDRIPKDPGYEIQKKLGENLKAQKWEIYSPLSVVNAVTSGINQNYWNQTETYVALSEYIAKNFDGLKEDVALLMKGERIRISTGNYQNDMTTFGGKDDIFALLVHLGYLGYDFDTKEIFIPNKEVLDEFKSSTQGRSWSYLFTALDNSQKLLEATWKCDAVTVARLIEAAHDRAGNKTYNDEAALSYAVQLAYYSALNYYTLIQELDTGKGYADLVYIPAPDYSDKPALLIELKYDKTADYALEQIKKRNYPAGLEHYRGNIIMVGINYDKEVSSSCAGYKHHSCVIERG